MSTENGGYRSGEIGLDTAEQFEQERVLAGGYIQSPIIDTRNVPLTMSRGFDAATIWVAQTGIGPTVVDGRIAMELLVDGATVSEIVAAQVDAGEIDRFAEGAVRAHKAVGGPAISKEFMRKRLGPIVFDGSKGGMFFAAASLAQPELQLEYPDPEFPFTIDLRDSNAKPPLPIEQTAPIVETFFTDPDNLTLATEAFGAARDVLLSADPQIQIYHAQMLQKNPPEDGFTHRLRARSQFGVYMHGVLRERLDVVGLTDPQRNSFAHNLSLAYVVIPQ